MTMSKKDEKIMEGAVKIAALYAGHPEIPPAIEVLKKMKKHKGRGKRAHTRYRKPRPRGFVGKLLGRY